MHLVYTATFRGDKVAIKSYFVEEMRGILAEAVCLKMLNTTGATPKLYGILPNPNPLDERQICLVMEMVGEGITLRRSLEDNALNIKQKLSIALCLVNGLLRIHQRGVLINDIKDDNIIVYDSAIGYQAKFIDFGHASYGFVKTYKGDTSMAYHLAPEVRNHQPTTPASDIYSLGYTLSFFAVNTLVDLANRCTLHHPIQRPSLYQMASEIMVLLNTYQPQQMLLSLSSTIPIQSNNAPLTAVM
ncbi:proto-oncogene serine/threonine-protein kinase mos-like isoform X2 [Argopecten irradians]|uniref:proto-oncogene serine/threonine-protein kinase mos-like isoform X2 n=1 Tax=Argopecten irradians TaxID=31199 RepID=UPI0037129CB9